MTYIMSCVWLDYMVKYFQCKNCVGSSPKTKKCVASFLVPGDRLSLDAFAFGLSFFILPLMLALLSSTDISLLLTHCSQYVFSFAPILCFTFTGRRELLARAEFCLYTMMHGFYN